ncbi:MAG: MgtC/SapB family protein [Pseudomonadota bacterium]
MAREGAEARGLRVTPHACAVRHHILRGTASTCGLYTALMDELEIFRRLGLALAIGLLFGLERGWHERETSEGGRVAGIRTFALTGLAGAVIGWLTLVTTPFVLGLGLLAVALLVAVSYWSRLRVDDDIGMTTEVALLLTFALGAAAVLAEMVPVAATGVVATTLLSLKRALHRRIAQIRRLELVALVQLALISVVILPILPNEGFGPGAVLNPYELWWAVVIVAGLSFFGYAAMRLAGPEVGILITGLFGGLASSTSTTLALSRLVRETPALGRLAAIGTVAAGSVTFLRVLVVAGIFEPALVALLAPSMGAMALTGFAGAVVLHATRKRSAADHPKIEAVSNPLALTTAASFALVLGLVMLGTHYLETWFGDAGTYAAAALSGSNDVDALTISVARMTGDDLPAAVAANAIFIAVSVNTVVKGGIAAVVGGMALGVRVMGVYLLVLAVGAAALRLLPAI